MARLILPISCLYSLEGHEYGGHCLQASAAGDLLYSASKDFSLKSWNLETRSLADSKTDHCDYVESIVVYPRWSTFVLFGSVVECWRLNLKVVGSTLAEKWLLSIFFFSI